MIIAPQKQFLVDLKINNPSDTDTYYVRALIKNSVTGATINTLNLTDNGSKYFSYLWVTPADVSGNGLQITILKTVYTDSGYTNESPIYGTILENYIVRDLPRTSLGALSGQSGGASGRIDYEKIRQMILEALASLPKLEIPEVNFDVAIQAIKEYDQSAGRRLVDVEDWIASRIQDISAENLKVIEKLVVNKLEELTGSFSNALAQLQIKNMQDLMSVEDDVKALTELTIQIKEEASNTSADFKSVLLNKFKDIGVLSKILKTISSKLMIPEPSLELDEGDESVAPVPPDFSVEDRAIAIKKLLHLAQ